MKNPYQMPTIESIGSLSELTLTRDCTPTNTCNKVNSPVSDGFTFQGQPINFS